MSNEYLKYLLEQYATGSSTPLEAKKLFEWIKKSKDDTLLKGKIKELWAANKNNQQLPDVDWNTIYTKIINTPVISKRRLWQRIAAAAIILLLAAGSYYFIFNNHSVKQITKAETPQQFKNDIPPGGNKAILTLANGKQIILDSAANGNLAQQGNIKIIKMDSGRVAYTAPASPLKAGDEVLQNTISTPRGGQYLVVLADGSKVWLNAASSIRFPISFTGNERNVEITGEGYFEVVHNAKKPFKVSVNGIEVQVLGTHFNINAYGDEATIKTTLLEGSVKVTKGSVSKMISPGEQALVSSSAEGQQQTIRVQTTDVDAAVAWKNGRFIFQGDNIQSVMRQLARWYDVDISYQGNVTDEEFVGVIKRSRYENISQILKMLEKTRTVSFVISGRNILVTPFKK